MSALEIIRTHIEREKDRCISFARFMELALYHPESGYYERCRIGREGDFFTSVSSGGLFGELLAIQFLEWKRTMHAPEAPQKWVLLEAGAHDGRLALDILWHLNRQNALDGAGLEYWILEPSATRRAVQQSALAAFSGHVRWFEGWNSLPAMGVAGVIFSNELLDAFPVHRLGWDAQARVWFEWGVGMEGGQCQWARVPRSECGAMKLARDWLRYSGLVDGSASKEVTDRSCNALFGMLPDGYILEASPLAWQWWAMAAKTLQAGWLLTFDYGFQVEELLSPLRTQGTLRAYHRHQLSQNILDQPGEQDLTASINFSMLQFIAEKAGLKMTLNGTQSLFLSQIVSRTLKKGGEQLPWDAQRLRQFHTLAHPDHLGEALKVAVFQTQDRQLKSE